MRFNNILRYSFIFIFFFSLNAIHAFANQALNLDRNTIQTIKEFDNPYYLGAVWPTDSQIKECRIPIYRVNELEFKKSIKWIKTIINKEWLKDDFEKELIALKQYKNWEKRDKNGIVFSEWKGDYLIADFIVNNNRINIQETGSSFSVLFIFPEKKDISRSPDENIKNYLKKFIIFPTDKIDMLDLKLKNKEGIYYGTLTYIPKDKKEEIYQDENNYYMNKIWWKYLYVCTDGSFFYLYCFETDGSPISPNASPGIPSRF